jgi:gliding motility-associated-like protein
MKQSTKVPPCSVLLLACVLFLFLDVKGQWTLPAIPPAPPNNAVNLGNNCFELTASSNNLGVVWNNTQMNLNQPFDITLSLNFQPWGADGIALVLQQTGLADFGCGANGLGYGQSSPAPPPGFTPIAPSIAFEADTWDNTGAGLFDVPADHVAIHQDGILTSALAGPASALASGMDITDGLCHQMRVTWAPGTTTLEVYFDGVLRITTVYDMINNAFGGNAMVWWGITGSSGGSAMQQIVCVGANFANVGVDRNICTGDTVHLQGTGGTGFSWQPAAFLDIPNIPTPVFGPAPAGTHYVYSDVTNAAGCMDRDTTVITVENTPVSNPGGPFTVCLGDSVQIGPAANPAYAYQWSPAAGLSSTTSAQPWATPAGVGLSNYTLIVTDLTGLAGCADTATTTVTAVDTPTVTVMAVNDTVCQGVASNLNAIVAGGTAPYGYLWSNAFAGSAQAVTPMLTTTFTVTVTDASTCSTEGSIIVTVNDTPAVATSASPPTICAGLTVQIDAMGSGGSGPYSFLWNTGATTASDFVAPMVNTTYSVSVTDASGCMGIGTVQVLVNVSDSLDITVPDTFLCLSGSIPILNTYNSAGMDTWNWVPALGVSNPSDPNPVITPSASTTYYLIGSNSTTGCGYMDSIRIAYFGVGAPVVALGSDTAICAGDTLVLDAGNPGFSYAWSTGDVSQQISVAVSGLYFVRVFDTVGCGYVNDDSLNLTVNPLPTPLVGPDTVICQGSSLLLTSGGAIGNHLWSTGWTGNNCAVSLAGTYWVEVTDGVGCSGRDSMVLGLNPQPVVSFGVLQPQYCETDPVVQLTGSPAGGTWAGTVSALGVFTPSVAGPGNHGITYSYVNAFGCTGTDTQNTAVIALPSPALAGPDQLVESQAVLQAAIPAMGLGQWTVNGFPGTISSLANPNAALSCGQEGTFPFIWTVSNAPCPANSDTVWITFEGIHIPTAFSPNGDGVNDNFVIRGLGGYPGTKVYVFNRWGNQVWASEDYQNDWIGQNAAAQPLVDDTYFAVIEYGGRAVSTYIVLKRD